MNEGARRLVALYEGAAAVELHEGRRWYLGARREASRLAREHGTTVHRAAAVIAALSPRQRWDRNLVLAGELLAGRRVRAVFGRCKRKARAIAKGHGPVARPLDVLGGQKVRAFYVAIASGGRDTRLGPVIDGHAWCAWGQRGDRPARNAYVGGRALVQCVADYEAAAAMVGEGLHEFQAVVWLRWRNGGRP